MIFHRLEISDFLVFKGKNTLTFPVTDDEPSMVVVLAPNNSGKTTIIKALRFLLYGTRPPGELCNHAAVDELRPGDRLNAWVGATVSVGNRSYTFRRRIDARKTKDGASEIENVILEQTQHDRGGYVYSPDQGEITRLLNSLVPEALFDFFYFQGETLADKLLQRSAHSSIGEALATLLHHKQWIRAAEAVDAVHAKLAEDIQDLSEVDRAYADQLKLVTQLEEKVAQSTRESAEFEQTTRDAAAEYESLGRQILDISTGKSFEDVAKKLDQIRKEFIDAGNQTGRVETEIAQTIGDSRGLPFFHDAFGAARAVLDSMQRENLLPADVVEGFLQRILDHQRCLCGRSLNEHEAEARAAVEAYRTRALSQDVNAALLDLLDRLSPNVQRNFTKFAISAAQGLEDQLLRRKKLLLRSKELESQASTLEDEIKRSNHEEVLRLQTRQKEALRRKDDFGEKRRKTEIYLGQQKNMLREAKDVLTRLGGKGFGARFDKLTKARIQAGALAELIRETIACLKDSFQS
ncbi:MAG TPA: AAA family ATPase, partial [Terriglobales bacterium]|nr:AAA family ATPase [Terriglobales bacterium]